MSLFNTVEITEAAFRALVPSDSPCVRVQAGESYRVEHYQAHGCELSIAHNYVSATVQHFIRDINA